MNGAIGYNLRSIVRNCTVTLSEGLSYETLQTCTMYVFTKFGAIN